MSLVCEGMAIEQADVDDEYFFKDSQAYLYLLQSVQVQVWCEKVVGPA